MLLMFKHDEFNLDMILAITPHFTAPLNFKMSVICPVYVNIPIRS